MDNHKRVLSFWGGHHESNILDLTLDYIHNGSEVLLLCCDTTEGMCIRNYRKCNLYCDICKKSKREVLHRFAKGFDSYKFLSEYLTDEIIKEANSFNLEYKTTKELKDIEYHGVEIGFGAFSTYVSLTRHCNPLYTQKVKEYLDEMMRAEIRLTLIVEKIINEFKPDLIILHNGRFAQYKPLLGLAKQKAIDFIASELMRDKDGCEIHNDFYNDIPHSATSFKYCIERDWNAADPISREKIARNFYDNRRHAIAAGDKVYTKDQQLGLLPDGWNKSRQNIAIFNSSEDEFFSISKEFDSSLLFESQFVALKTILDHYANDSTKHFYLRIHPNLKDVDDISHLALYKLKYGNLTIIPPTSPISTYTLIDNADKIIVFNSTVGVEAAYWGKAVVSLNMCAYDSIDVTYKPSSEKEVFELLDAPKLNPKYNDGVLKYAYYLFKINYPKQKYLHNYWRSKKLLGFTVEDTNVFTLFGSKLMYAFANFMVNRIPLHFKPFAKYRQVPNDRDLWTIDIKD